MKCGVGRQAAAKEGGGGGGDREGRSPAEAQLSEGREGNWRPGAELSWGQTHVVVLSRLLAVLGTLPLLVASTG